MPSRLSARASIPPPSRSITQTTTSTRAPALTSSRHDSLSVPLEGFVVVTIEDTYRCSGTQGPLYEALRSISSGGEAAPLVVSFVYSDGTRSTWWSTWATCKAASGNVAKPTERGVAGIVGDYYVQRVNVEDGQSSEYFTTDN